jgi:hypothetical protein
LRIEEHYDTTLILITIVRLVLTEQVFMKVWSTLTEYTWILASNWRANPKSHYIFARNGLPCTAKYQNLIIWTTYLPTKWNLDQQSFGILYNVKFKEEWDRNIEIVLDWPCPELKASLQSIRITKTLNWWTACHKWADVSKWITKTLNWWTACHKWADVSKLMKE